MSNKFDYTRPCCPTSPIPKSSDWGIPHPLRSNQARDTVHNAGVKAGVSPLGTAKEELTDKANEVSKKKALSNTVINKFTKRMLFRGFEK
jgi:hypothetical protein